MFRSSNIMIVTTALALTLAVSPAGALASTQATYNHPELSPAVTQNSTTAVQQPDDRTGSSRPAPPVLHVGGGTTVVGLPDNRANRQGPAAMAPPTVVIHATTTGGFNWGDAAVGAAVMLGLMFLIGGTVAGVRSHRGQLAA